MRRLIGMPRKVTIRPLAIWEARLEKEKAMAKKREAMGPDAVRYDPGERVIGAVIITGAMFQCTSCGGLKPASEFGLRMTEDNVVRNQAQCKACR